MAKISIPTPLRRFTDNEAQLQTTGNNVQEAIQELADTYPDLKPHLLDDEGHLKPFIRIYIGDEDIKALQQEATPVNEETTINLIPAIAGGR